MEMLDDVWLSNLLPTSMRWLLCVPTTDRGPWGTHLAKPHWRSLALFLKKGMTRLFLDE